MAAATGISKTTFHRWLQTFFGPAPPAEIVQALHRSVLCREGLGHCLPVPEPARQGDGVLRRREEADPGSRPNPATNPMGLGYVEGVTHDYIRHGTTTLFAALVVATGEVITQCKPRHRPQEFLGVCRTLAATTWACRASEWE